MNERLFVFGTLKQGFCNFHVNAGRRVGDVFVTRERHPLYVIGPRHLPWLLERPGEGHAVRGQLFEVDPPALAAMDALERIHDPRWYQRRRIEVVEPASGGAPAGPIEAWVYFGSALGFEGQTVHAGPLAEYTLELEHRLRPTAR